MYLWFKKEQKFFTKLVKKSIFIKLHGKERGSLKIFDFIILQASLFNLRIKQRFKIYLTRNSEYNYVRITVRDAFGNYLGNYQFGHTPLTLCLQPNFLFVFVTVKIRKQLWPVFLHLDRHILPFYGKVTKNIWMTEI